MNAITIILMGIAGIIVLLLIAGLFMKREHYVNREIIINAPLQQVFEFLRFLKNQDRFNKWAKAGQRKETHHGTDGTVGYVYSWSGDKSAGHGEKEIMKIIEGRKIETEIRFTKPMRVSASVIMETEAISKDQTKVNFINAGRLSYPFNLMIPVAEKNFARDLDTSLATLKRIMEDEWLKQKNESAVAAPQS